MGKGVIRQLLYRFATNDDSDDTATVPDGVTWDIEGIFATLISSGSAGNRRLQVDVKIPDSGGTVRQIGAIPSANVQAASLTHQYNFVVGGSLAGALVGTAHLDPLPDFDLPAGSTIRVYDVAAIDAAADDMTVQIYGEAVYVG